MSRIDQFKEPLLRTHSQEPPKGFEYVTSDLIELECADHLRLPPFNEVLDKRFSQRELSSPSINQLGHLLWLGCRVRASKESPIGLIQTRPAPASGGLHAIDILVSNSQCVDGPAVYDPHIHALRPIANFDSKRLEMYHARIRDLFPSNEGCVLTLLADHGKLDAKYENWESLALRDAGALLATLGLCAEGLGMGFCIAGLLGNDLLGAELASSGAPIPVGSAIFGATNRSSREVGSIGEAL